jgi:hypothetical protein
VEVVHNGSTLASTPLDRGVGQVNLPLPLTATVTAYDASGAVVAQRDFADNESGSTDLEQEYHGW